MQRFPIYLISLSPACLRHRYKRVATVAVLACSACVSLASDNNPSTSRNTVYHTEPPAPKEIGQHLFPEKPPATRTRSIVFTNPEEAEQPERSVGMPILFHFGKTTIVEKSQPFLDSVGQMLTSEAYADRTLVVEGHTDAVGSRTYNQRLSELRALAIKEYLVAQFSIDPYRLFPVGKGEEMLYRPDSPKDAMNRRVEFLPHKGDKGLQFTNKSTTANDK